ncbi:MAG: hypothetical protein RL226_1374 [Bacteroidota bacterium]
MNLNNGTLRLRPVQSNDVEILLHWENDPSHWWVSGITSPYSRADIEGFVSGITDIHQDKQFRWVIEHEGHPIGTIDLYEFDAVHRRAGVGILIAERSKRQKGLGELALRLLMEHGQDVLSLHQLYAAIPESNEASIRLFEKCGFVRTAVRREWLQFEGRFEDELFYQRIFEQ